jgi:hypothetical protein
MSLRVSALTFRLVTWQRMSFSDPLVWSGILGRSSTLNNSGLLALSRASSRSSVTNPVLSVKMRSNLACSAYAVWWGRDFEISLNCLILLAHPKRTPDL